MKTLWNPRLLLLAPVVCLALSANARAHITLDSPNGGEQLECGTVMNIQWHPTALHDKDDYDLEYSVTGSSGPWLPIELNIPPTQLNFNWTVPDNLSTQVFVRVTQDLPTGNDYTDTSDSALSIVNTIFADLGFGKVGGNGLQPQLSACGDLSSSGSQGALRLEDAAASRPVLLIGALTSTPVPFVGGTLVPGSLQIAVPFTTDAQGGLELPLPGGFAPLDLYLQYVISDPGATQGVALSNAAKIIW